MAAAVAVVEANIVAPAHVGDQEGRSKSLRYLGTLIASGFLFGSVLAIFVRGEADGAG